jgi:hypothetical protein
MKQRCKVSGEEFEVAKEDLDLLDRISPEILGKKFRIPPPQHCPEVRLQKRLIFRNERFLYGRESAFSNKRILSVFSPDGPYRAIDQDEWWGDYWDGRAFGRQVKVNEDIFKQLNKLALSVPHIGLFNKNVENGYYSNYCLNTKNCYLVYGTTNSEDCQYCKFATDCKDCIDCLTVLRSELCYQAVCCSDCYNCQYTTNCRNCRDCISCLDCQSCSSCLGCYGLTSKEFYVFNEFVGKARFNEYQAKLEDPSNQSIKRLNEKLLGNALNFPRRANYILSCENCSGDSLYNCKDCHYCFDMSESEGSRYSAYMPKAIYSLDCSYGAPDGIQFSYNLCSSVGTMNSICTFLCWYCDTVFYCLECQSCKNCFGCVGLRNKEYCILNHQYTKDQYEKLLVQLVSKMQADQTWGDYFPSWCSYFAYNETLAQEYFPLSKEEAISFGFSWRERPLSTSSLDQALERYLIPERISATQDSIVNQVMECSLCQRHYRVNASELKFYRKLRIPIQLECPDCRHLARLKRRNPPILWERDCAKTGKKIWTSFNQGRNEIVYSNDAWEAEFRGD